LNGINPLTPILFSLVPFSMMVLGYQLSNYLTLNFAVSFLYSDLYTIQRLAVVARNVIVGLTILATAFCGVIGLGLFLLGMTVLIGILKGELNPNKVDLKTDIYN
jgi:hypothetical protein